MAHLPGRLAPTVCGRCESGNPVSPGVLRMAAEEYLNRLTPGIAGICPECHMARSSNGRCECNE